MVSEQKYRNNVLSVAVTFFFLVYKSILCSLGLIEASSEVLKNSFKIFKTPLSSSSNPSDMLTLLEEFCTTHVSVQRLGGGIVSSQQKNYLQQA